LDFIDHLVRDQLLKILIPFNYLVVMTMHLIKHILSEQFGHFKENYLDLKQKYVFQRFT